MPRRPFAAAARRSALALAAGFALAAGQVPFSIWPAAIAGLAVALWLVATAPNARAGLREGLLFGLGHFLIALEWIAQPFLVDPERHGWMAPFAHALMAAGLAVFWSGATWGAVRLVPQRGARRAIVAAAALGTAEVVRSHLFGGFPWVLLGHVWLDWAPAQAAAIVGAHGLGVLTLFGVVLPVAALLMPALPAARRLALAAAGPAALAAVALFGLWQAGREVPAPPGATVRLVQPNARQDHKWDPVQLSAIRARLVALTAAPAAGGARPDLVVWPESAVAFLLGEDPAALAEIAASAGGGRLALGIQRLEGTRYFNSLAVIEPSGAVGSVYDKHHLVPFGEFIPLGDLMAEWFGIIAFAAQEGAGFTPGPGPQLIDVGAAGMALPLICYEAVFARQIAAAPQRPGLMLQVTNDAWFGTRSGPWQHLSLARLRAIEFGLPLLRAANTGISAVIDARGRVVAELGLGQDGFIDAPLPAALGPTPYSLWGDWPAHGALFLMWLVALGRRGSRMAGIDPTRARP
jgi:apolipoprotein N-acyltransferase